MEPRVAPVGAGPTVVRIRVRMVPREVGPTEVNAAIAKAAIGMDLRASQVRIGEVNPIQPDHHPIPQKRSAPEVVIRQGHPTGVGPEDRPALVVADGALQYFLECARGGRRRRRRRRGRRVGAVKHGVGGVDLVAAVVSIQIRLEPRAAPVGAGEVGPTEVDAVAEAAAIGVELRATQVGVGKAGPVQRDRSRPLKTSLLGVAVRWVRVPRVHDGVRFHFFSRRADRHRARSLGGGVCQRGEGQYARNDTNTGATEHCARALRRSLPLTQPPPQPYTQAQPRTQSTTRSSCSAEQLRSGVIPPESRLLPRFSTRSAVQPRSGSRPPVSRLWDSRSTCRAVQPWSGSRPPFSWLLCSCSSSNAVQFLSGSSPPLNLLNSSDSLSNAGSRSSGSGPRSPQVLSWRLRSAVLHTAALPNLAVNVP
eukprot:scaffold32637_cov61-Phaeocystis_antarctica.AAC.5